MKKCRYAKLTQRHADGELSARHEARLTAHLDGCASCRALLDGTAALKMQLSALAVAPRPGLEGRILATVNSGVQKPKFSYKWRDINILSRRLLPVAASLCLLLGGLTVFQILGVPDSGIDPLKTVGLTSASANEEQYYIWYKLSDPEKTFMSEDKDKSLEILYDSLGSI